MLGNGPGKGQPVVSACSSADLVEYYEGLFSGIVDYVCCFGHLDHKGGLAADQFIRGADAGEYSVDQPDSRIFSGYKRAGLCHQDQKSGLSYVCAFSAHIRACDN